MHPGQPIDSATHVFCVRLAWTLVNHLVALLRPEEVNDCAAQFYQDIRDALQKQEQPHTPA
jgi:hypothetical protein